MDAGRLPLMAFANGLRKNKFGSGVRKTLYGLNTFLDRLAVPGIFEDGLAGLEKT